ncbi:MAG: radical SAM protein, partial [Candidatus Omnitrophica bacterium]|nr:radical SAM protein [Candidatus Omnitrophota bacterium]
MKIIPIFIPHAGCPYKCVYCDQHRISGARRIPTAGDINSIIQRNLKSISKDEDIEVGFFGGTFTFLPVALQKKYLEVVSPYIKKGIINSIRISTHPETISLKAMRRFKKSGGRLVELGIQSLDKETLRRIKRKTDFGAIKKAVKYIKKAGLDLGVQVMLGLPGDTLEKAIQTAKKLIGLGPETARIYPTLVIKGTELAREYKKGKYKPLSLKNAIEQAAVISEIFEEGGVKVIRIGLHPSRDLDSKNTMIKGPYHCAFGEMVRARTMCNKIMRAIKDRHLANRSHIEILAPENMFNFISGHRGSERKFLERYFGVPILLRRAEKIEIIDRRKDIAVLDPRMPRAAKERLKKLNYHVVEVPLHKKLQDPVKGHVDMMLFARFSRVRSRIVYEPCLENIAALLRQNGYRCLKGKSIQSSKYPKNIIYNACSIDSSIIHYRGNIEKNIKMLKAKHVLVSQGYAKCSI